MIIPSGRVASCEQILQTGDTPLQLAMFFSRHRCVASCKFASCDMALCYRVPDSLIAFCLPVRSLQFYGRESQKNRFE